MKEKFIAYASILSNFLEEFPFNNSGKLATLWFDEIVFQVDLIEGAAEFVAEREDWDSKTLTTLKKVWVPLSNHLPDMEFLNKDLIPEHPDLEETTFKITYDETKKDAEKWGFDISNKNNYYAMMHEVAWAYRGTLESINSWMLLHKLKPCVFLPIERENLVLQQLFSTAMMQKPNVLFSEIISHELTNLDSLTWDDILEIKNHDYFKHFRNKMIEIQNELNTGNKDSVIEFVKEIKITDMEDLILKQKPKSTVKSLSKAIASNFPLPIPINPYAIYSDAKQIKEEIDIMKRYGWLYFLLDIKKKVT